MQSILRNGVMSKEIDHPKVPSLAELVDTRTLCIFMLYEFTACILGRGARLLPFFVNHHVSVGPIPS